MPNGRCRQHGGASDYRRRRLVWEPGLEVARARRPAWLEVRRLLGLRYPGGRPSGKWAKASLDDRQKVVAGLSEVIDSLPVPSADKPLAQWTHAELLSDTARLGLLRVREILLAEIDPYSDVKERRLVAEVGMNAAKLLARVQEAAMRQADSEDWRGLLERIEKAGKNSAGDEK